MDGRLCGGVCGPVSTGDTMVGRWGVAAAASGGGGGGQEEAQAPPTAYGADVEQIKPVKDRRREKNSTSGI